MAGWTWTTSWEEEGYFWLPGEEERFYGRLQHSPDEGSRFHFVGAPLADADDLRLKSVAVIHGETLGGKALSLFNFFPTSWTLGDTRTGVIDGFADTVVSGGAFENFDAIQTAIVTASLHGLVEFLCGGSVESGLLNPNIDPEGFRSDVLNAQIDEHVSLLLSAGRERSGGRRELINKTVASAQLTASAPMSLRALEDDYLNPLRELVLFATRRLSYVRSMSHWDTVDAEAHGQVLRSPWPSPNARNDRDVYALALNLERLSEPAEVIKRWYRLRESIGPVWSLFFAALGGQAGLLDNRFLNLMAFAEGYHRAIHDRPPLSKAEAKAAEKAVQTALREHDAKVRRVFKQALAYANSQTQRDRLADLTGRALSVIPDWDLDVDELCGELSHTRNWMTHWGRRGSRTRDDTEGLVVITRTLELILYCNLMLDMGLTTDEATAEVRSGWRLDGLP